MTEHTCPICGEYMGAWQEWKLRPGYEVGKLVAGDEYAHKECVEE